MAGIGTANDAFTAVVDAALPKLGVTEAAEDQFDAAMGSLEVVAEDNPVAAAAGVLLAVGVVATIGTEAVAAAGAYLVGEEARGNFGVWGRMPCTDGTQVVYYEIMRRISIAWRPTNMPMW